MPSEDLSGLLGTLADRVEAGELDAARGALDDVESTYETLDTSERVKQRKAVLARDSLETDRDVRERLDEFAQAVNAADLGRAGILSAATLYLAAPEEADAGTVAGKLRDQSEQESTLVDLEASVGNALDEVSLPPALLVENADVPGEPRPKGTAFDVSATVRNVGDEPAAEVSLSSDSTADVAPASVSLGDLPADDSASATVTVGADQAGEFELQLRAAGDPGRADGRTERFRVVAMGGAISRAREALEDLVEYVEERDELTGGRENAALSKLNAADEKLDDAAEFVEEEKAKQADNMCNAASRMLGAFLNQVDGLAGGTGTGTGKGDGKSDQNDLSPSFVRTVETLAEGAIDRLSLARQAEL